MLNMSLCQQKIGTREGFQKSANLAERVISMGQPFNRAKSFYRVATAYEGLN